MTGIESINRILDVWGGEIRDRIEVEGNQITGRYIDILTRRGSDTGKRWEIDKDIIEITRLTQSYPKTALYGRGEIGRASCRERVKRAECNGSVKRKKSKKEANENTKKESAHQ